VEALQKAFPELTPLQANLIMKGPHADQAPARLKPCHEAAQQIGDLPIPPTPSLAGDCS